MSWLTTYASELLWRLGQRALSHSRRLSPRAEKEAFAHWDQPHLVDPRGVCMICGGENADPKARCPGTPAQQQARAELARGNYQ